jgi:hypothetical protein
VIVNMHGGTTIKKGNASLHSVLQGSEAHMSQLGLRGSWTLPIAYNSGRHTNTHFPKLHVSVRSSLRTKTKSVSETMCYFLYFFDYSVYKGWPV